MAAAVPSWFCSKSAHPSEKKVFITKNSLPAALDAEKYLDDLKMHASQTKPELVNNVI